MRISSSPFKAFPGLLAASLLLAPVSLASLSNHCPATGKGENSLKTVGNRSFMSTRKGLVEMSTTSYCLTCHDGAVASPINAHMQTGPSSAAATASLRTRNGSKFAAIAFASLNASRSGDTHPVDLRYPDWNPKFRPLAEVQEKLPLPGGMLTCETCHSGNEASIGNLTISNRGSALCLTCHLK